jgi:GNAT superfamily N-acetyltransferase
MVWPPRSAGGRGVKEGAMATGLQWIREDAPRWDADKRRLFGEAELAATALNPPAAGAPVADEWWHVADAAGVIVGYGWLDSEWGDAEVTFLVAPGRRGERVGEFIIDHLEAEAAARGLNYIYNVVPVTSPNPEWVTAWLVGHGFVAGDGDLRRRVREGVAG